MEENHNTQINEVNRQYLNQLTQGYSYQPGDEEIMELLRIKNSGGEILNAPIFSLDSMVHPPEILVAPFPRLKQSDNYHFLFKGEPPKQIGNDLVWKPSRTKMSNLILKENMVICYRERYYLNKKQTGWNMTVYKLDQRAFNLREAEWRFIKLKPPLSWGKNPAPILENSTHNEQVVMSQNEGTTLLMTDVEAQYAAANLAQPSTHVPEVGHQVNFEQFWDQGVLDS